jgi:hypothetical protein
VADALKRVNRASLRHRFDAIDDPDYRGTRDDADFQYTWDPLVDVATFYQRAVSTGRAVVFTAT